MTPGDSTSSKRESEIENWNSSGDYPLPAFLRLISGGIEEEAVLSCVFVPSFGVFRFAAVM